MSIAEPSSFSALKPLACDHGLRRQSLVESLLSDVFSGHVSPGQHLVTQELAARFGVSHTPIREALIALAGIGIVELVPNRGAMVRPIGPNDVREICLVRRALECEATRAACGKADPVELSQLAAALRQLIDTTDLPAAEFIAAARLLDTRLHDLVSSSCGNAFLIKELNRLKTLFRGFRDMMYARYKDRNDVRRLRDEAQQHLDIVDALIAVDRHAAVRAMSRHIHSGVKYWTRALATWPGGLAPATNT